MGKSRNITLYNLKGKVSANGIYYIEGHVVEDNEVGTVHMNPYDFIMDHGGFDNLSRIDFGKPLPKTLMQVLREEGLLDTADPLLLK